MLRCNHYPSIRRLLNFKREHGFGHNSALRGGNVQNALVLLRQLAIIVYHVQDSDTLRDGVYCGHEYHDIVGGIKLATAFLAQYHTSFRCGEPQLPRQYILPGVKQRINNLADSLGIT